MTSPFRTTKNEDDIRHFAKKGNKQAQIHLINNPHTPNDVIADLAGHKDKQIAEEAARRLADPDSFLEAIRAEIHAQEKIEGEQAELDRLTQESRSLSSKPSGLRNRIPISTTADIPGRPIIEHISFVHAVSTLDAEIHDRKRAEHELRDDMVRDVREKLVVQTLALGGNAIVGVALTWASGNIGGATIGAAAGRGDRLSAVMTGTAVRVQTESDLLG